MPPHSTPAPPSAVRYDPDTVPQFSRRTDSATFRDGVERCREHIRAGDAFPVYPNAEKATHPMWKNTEEASRYLWALREGEDVSGYEIVKVFSVKTVGWSEFLDTYSGNSEHEGLVADVERAPAVVERGHGSVVDTNVRKANRIASCQRRLRGTMQPKGAGGDDEPVRAVLQYGPAHSAEKEMTGAWPEFTAQSSMADTNLLSVAQAALSER